MRILFAVGFWGLLLALSRGLGVWWSDGHPILWALLFWSAAMMFMVRPFMVAIPEITGLVTVNFFNGQLTIYGTGMHFRFPWEQVREGNFINLRLVTERKVETYPAKDGPAMHVEWSYQYRPLIERLDVYISVDATTINQGLKDVGSSLLAIDIARQKSEDCKRNHATIEQKLVLAFENMVPRPDELYGIDLVRVSLVDVDYEPVVQKVRASELVTAKLRKIAADIRKEHSEISQKDAMNAAMIVNGNISKTVTEVEGEGGEALAALLIAMSKGGK